MKRLEVALAFLVTLDDDADIAEIIEQIKGAGCAAVLKDKYGYDLDFTLTDGIIEAVVMVG